MTFSPRLATAIVLAAGLAIPAFAQQASNATFFVTSAGPGKGADLGGIEGADRHCQTLAQAAGAGAKTWRAYLSTQVADGKPAVNAKDRIGKGPFVNVKGVTIAKDVAEFHGADNKIAKETALTEKGEMVMTRGDARNDHDILTGSQPDGTAFAAAEDRTCKNWTSSAEGSAMVGHVDRRGTSDTPEGRSWVTSHPSRGCSADGLRSSGGGGLFYCVAVQ